MVSASRKLHELGGGDDVKRGKEWSEVNPAIIQYLWEQYTGGPGKVLSNTISLGKDAKDLFSNGEAPDFNLRKVEGLKAFIQQGDENTAYYRTKAKFKKYKEDADELYYQISNYKKDASVNPEHFMELKALERGADYTRMTIVREYEKDMRGLNKLIGNAEGRERKELIQQQNLMTKYVVDMLDNVGHIDHLEDDDVRRQAKWLKYKGEAAAVKDERDVYNEMGDEASADSLDNTGSGQRSKVYEGTMKTIRKIDRKLKKTDDRDVTDNLERLRQEVVEEAVDKMDDIR
jgi:hypothetical protein